MNIRGYRVFFIDPEEDINSLIEELNKSTAEKLALVVDRRCTIFNSKINIQLLQKYLKDWGKELVFVSPENRLIRLVLETDLKIYPDLDALKRDEPILDVNEPLVTELDTEILLPEIVSPDTDRDNIPMYRSNRRQKSRGRLVAGFILAFALLGGLVWIYFGFPVITVEVSPSIQKFEQEIQLNCEYGLEQIRSQERKIPLLTFKSDAEGQVKVLTTGRKKIGFTRAEGVVLFINNQPKAVTVPAGTIVRTKSGIKFKTIQAVTVPEVEAEYIMGVLAGTQAGKAEASIVALEPGSLGNISSGRITEFEGKDYGLKVINPEATRGGTDKEEMVVTQEDLNRVISQLEKELKRLIQEQLAKEIGVEYLVIEETLDYVMEDVNVDHHVDEKAEEITANGKIIVSGYLLLKNDLKVITEEIFLSQIPEGYSLHSPQIQISQVKVVSEDKENLSISLKASGQVVAQIRARDIVEKLKGQSVEYADGLLRKMKEIRYFRINADGKSRIPNFSFAIRVLVKEPGENEEGNI